MSTLVSLTERLRALAPAVRVILRANRRFFRRFPNRKWRVRIAARAEVEEARLKGALTAPLPSGYRFFVGVRRDAKGVLSRMIGVGPDIVDCDVDEATARMMFSSLAAHDDQTLIKLAGRSGKAAPSTLIHGGAR
jgi:hypothetical protein